MQLTTCLNHHHLSRRGVSDRAPKAQIRIIGVKFKGNEGRIYGNYNREGHYVRDGNYTREKNFVRGNYGNRNDRNEPYVPPQNCEVNLRDGGNSMARVEDMLHKMMRRLDASDEHIKELKGVI